MPLRIILIAILSIHGWVVLKAQLPYTELQYEVWEEKNIAYGTAVNFAGAQVDLSLDLYKPVGDNNCLRPLLVMIHGGAWIAGTKDDGDVVAICREMAARGYACASINYRLGVHPDDFYEPYFFCNDNLNPLGLNKCLYNADTMEITRALYRGMQDAKGAIRFLKGRHELDSTDLQNVMVGGSSAGAFVALAVGLLDRLEEKPAFALTLPDAPLPDNDLASCVPAPADRSRPDLGSIEGSLHTGVHDADVKGVAAFMGGIFDPSILEGPDTPAIYLYHRTDDLVVSCTGNPLLPIYPHCINPLNLCQPLSNRPFTHGSCSISEWLDGSGNPALPFFNDILDFGPEGGDDCLDNPPGHSIQNIPERSTNLAGFFAPMIAASGNDPAVNCQPNSVNEFLSDNLVRVFPNPVQHAVLNFSCENWGTTAVKFQLMDRTGRELATATALPDGFQWDLGHLNLPSGIYYVGITGAEKRTVVKVVF